LIHCDISCGVVGGGGRALKGDKARATKQQAALPVGYFFRAGSLVSTLVNVQVYM
jgi:hypothetical protein